MPLNPPRHSLTIYLLKQESSTPRLALRDPTLPERKIKLLGGELVGRLFVKQAPTRAPRWASFFDGAAQPPLPKLFGASASGVLLVEIQGTTLAVAFGLGRHLLAAGAYEERFGLIVTLNSIPTDKLRSLDVQSFHSVPRHSRTQTSREGDVTAFGFDVERDLLRAVTGTPSDRTLGDRLDGMDALHVSIQIDLPGLKPLLARYLAKYAETGYKEAFPWVDQLSQVRDKATLEWLNDRLLEKLRGGRARDRAALSVPEIIDWKDVAGFRYPHDPRGSDPHPDLDLRDFLEAQATDDSELTLERLRRAKVSCRASSTETPLHTWSAYQCIYAEIDEGDRTYLLSAGKWYAVSATFVAEVNASVKSLTDATADLPEYNDLDEEAYNARAAAENPDLALMDRKNIRYGASRSSVELCDLFAKKKQLIHVKRGTSSAVLSHLFSQGAVSAELFTVARDFRDLCRARLPASHRHLVSRDRPAHDEYEVVFAVITVSAKIVAEALPFFSRVNLRSRAQTLRALGYRVSLTKISIHPSVVVRAPQRRIRAQPPAATIPTLAGPPPAAPPAAIPGPGAARGRPSSGKRRPPVQR